MDRNYQSYSGEQLDVVKVKLDPQPPEWPLGSWQDTMKLSRCTDGFFEGFVIVRGGTEDVIDINNRSSGNELWNFVGAATGRYFLTLKGGSCNNWLVGFVIEQGGAFVDCAFGAWSDQSVANSTGNVLSGWERTDGKPVTYAYRWGNKPRWEWTKVKHLWWLSIGITLHWWGKWLLRAAQGKLPKN